MSYSFSASGMSAWPIALLRIYAGVLFIRHGWGKLSQGNEFAGKMEGFLRGNAEQSYAFYQPFVENVVLPNSALFANLVTWGELLVGFALVLGLATRWAGLAGAVMVANFWFAQGADPLRAGSTDVVWMVIFLVLALIPAGRVLGLDARLADRFAVLR